MRLDKLLSNLNMFQASDNSCKKVYCTTCGGVSHAISSNITPQIKDEINDALSKLSLNDFLSLGEWCEYLEINYPFGVQSIYKRASENMALSTVEELDYYLFNSRKAMKYNPVYKKLLDHGIQVAIDTSNESLIESIAIILGEKILDHEELLQLTLKKSKTNNNVHRALYNSLREKLPQVRNFVGDGSSFVRWW